MILEIVALVGLGFWVLLFVEGSRLWPGDCRLAAGGGSWEGTAPRLVAVVPAREEAEVLPRTLPALLGQDLPGFRVVLVDDGSRDGTAEVARQVARETGAIGRLQVIQAPPAPPGWSGKVHALARGVEAAVADSLGEEPEWLLFTDADIHHRPGSVRDLLAQAREGPYDLVSVMARLRAKTFWEWLLIPPFVFFFNLLYPFRRVNDPRSRVAAAAGGCLLLRREALERAGGFPAIRGTWIDDVALAQRVKAAAGRIWLGLDPGIVSVREYPGLRDLWRMVARSAFAELRFRYDLLLAVLAASAVLLVAPPFLLLAGLAGAVQGSASLMNPSFRILLWAAATWGLQSAALLPWARHHRVPTLYALTLPFASLLYALMTAGSAWDHLRGRGPAWKGRRYRDV